jgi:hypothetical protein
MTSISTTERIPLTKYEKCGGSYGIDLQSTVAPLFFDSCDVESIAAGAGAISKEDWEEFCHVADTYLKPINRRRFAMKVLMVILAVWIMLFFVFIFAGYNADTQIFFTNHRLMLNVSICITAILIIVAIGLAYHITVSTKEAFMNVKALCEEQSKVLDNEKKALGRSQLLTFHLCDERSMKGPIVDPHNKQYTGQDYFHHGFRTYHNVYILAVVVCIVDAECGYSFAAPKFPTMEIAVQKDCTERKSTAESTIGDMTMYFDYSREFKMTTTEKTDNKDLAALHEDEEYDCPLPVVDSEGKKKKKKSTTDKKKKKKTTNTTKDGKAIKNRLSLTKKHSKKADKTTTVLQNQQRQKDQHHQ